MIPAGSRYEDGERVWTKAHVYDRYQEPAYEEDTVYERLVETREAVFMFRTLPLPSRPDGEYFIKELEDMALISFKFMEDATQWWRLADVNPQNWYPLDVNPGEALRIPGT